MLISIITVVRNAEKTIERTIKSVVSQTYPHIEYIIIDGQSTDRTIEIINSYAPQISYWKSESDGGISDAFNKGLKLAQGEVIAFLNGDDFYADDQVIERVAKAFQAHPERKMIYGKAVYQDPISLRVRPVPIKPFELKTFKRHMTVPHLALFMKRELIKSTGYFNTNYRLAMDYDYVFRAIRFGFPLFLDSIFTVISLGGISNQRLFQSFIEVFQIQRSQGVSIVASGWALTVNVSKSFLRLLLIRLHCYPILRFYYRLRKARLFSGSN